jgi:hypothetical protein
LIHHRQIKFAGASLIGVLLLHGRVAGVRRRRNDLLFGRQMR